MPAEFWADCGLVSFGRKQSHRAERVSKRTSSCDWKARRASSVPSCESSFLPQRNGNVSREWRYRRDVRATEITGGGVGGCWAMKSRVLCDQGCRNHGRSIVAKVGQGPPPVAANARELRHSSPCPR